MYTHIVANGTLLKKKNSTHWNTNSSTVNNHCNCLYTLIYKHYIKHGFGSCYNPLSLQNDLQEFYSLIEFCNPGILGIHACNNVMITTL